MVKLGFGPKAVAFAIAITSQQKGRVEINKTHSTLFPLSSGVRQGNPLLPTLYILSLEPLLRWINLRLEGVTFLTQHKGPRYCAFADDIAVFITTYSDVRHLRDLLETDAAMSGSQINKHKSVFYTFDSEFGERLGDLLDFQVKDFNDALFKYLGINYAGVKWDQVISRQMWRLSSYDLNSYPPHLRAQAINSLFLSRVIYRDLTCPMPEATMKKLDGLIHKSFFNGISSDRAYGPVNKGGYGLLKFQQQLLGRRAKMIFDLFQPKARDNWAKDDFIERLLLIATLQGLPPSPRAWCNLLLDPDNLDEITASNLIEPREQAWLEAWAKLVKVKQVPPDITSEPKVAELPQLVLQGKHDPDGTTLSVQTFHNTHKKLYNKRKWIDVPRWPEKYFGNGMPPNPQEWRIFWNQVLKITNKQPWSMEIVWQFYHGYTQTWKWKTHLRLTADIHASFYFPSCTLCAAITSQEQQISNHTTWNDATAEHRSQFDRRLRSIQDGLGNIRHTLCECPVSKTIFSMVNRKDHPYHSVTALLPPRRFSLVELNEVACYLRATLLLEKETRLSGRAPVSCTEATLKPWIKNNQHYITTGKGQHKV